MSTIRCDNFGPSAGGTTYSARGIAKAWVNHDNSGSVADSLNVSSVTDNGVGQFAVNLTSALLAAANFGGGAANQATGVAGLITNTASAYTANHLNDAGNFADPNAARSVILGDLA